MDSDYERGDLDGVVSVALSPRLYADAYLFWRLRIYVVAGAAVLFNRPRYGYSDENGDTVSLLSTQRWIPIAEMGLAMGLGPASKR
jgi:hypothetical protein